MNYYRKNKVSLGKAAELAGYSRMDFIKKLQDNEEYIIDYSDEEIKKIFQDIDKIK